MLLNGTILDALPIELVLGTDPAVDAVGRDFLVAARFHHPVLSSNPRIHALRVSGATGAVLDPAPLLLDFAGGFVDLVGLQDRWLVAFGGIRLVEVSAAGVAGPAVYSADTGSGSAGSYLRLERNRTRTEALLTYESRDQSGVILTTDIRMRRFAPDGSSTDPFLGPKVTTASNAQLRPAGAYVGDELFFGWADHRAQASIEPGIGDIYAGRLDLQATRLDGDGLPLLTSDAAEGSFEVIGLAGGRALMAASIIQRSGPGEGIHRVHIATYGADPISAVGCTQTVPNASGSAGQLMVFGSPEVAQSDLRLVATAVTANAFGFFLVSPTAGLVLQPGGSRGNLCLGSSIGRYVGPGELQNSGPGGSFELSVDPVVTPSPAGFVSIAAGTTWFYQAWHRDAFMGGATSNFTGSAAVTFR